MKCNDKQNWAMFERLSLLLVEDNLDFKPSNVNITPLQKDGGFDARLDFNISNSLNMKFKTLVEMKLRSSNNLGLREFAATLIISYCEAADILLIVTNQFYTPQALEYVCKFLFKTNMQIKLVDGYIISTWIEKNYNKLLNDFDKEFLDFLRLDKSEVLKIKENLLNCNEKTFNNQQNGQFDLVPKVKIIDNSTEEKIVPYEIKINYSFKDIKLKDIVGTTHKSLVDEISLILKKQQGTIVSLLGNAGSGKSFLIKHILHNIISSEKNTVWIAQFNLGDYKTSRVLFKFLLNEIIGIDLQEILDDNNTDIENLITKAGGKFVNEQIKKDIISIFNATQNEYLEHTDLFSKHLLDFIEQIFLPYIKERKVIFIFEELNRASSELLEFLNLLFIQLRKIGINVLFELRDNSFTYNSQELVSLNEWSKYIDLFKKSSDYQKYIEPLLDEEVYEYINSLLPNIGKQRAKIIKDRIGSNPLFIKLTVDWLDNNNVLNDKDSIVRLIADLEKFYEKLTPDNVTPILDMTIKDWWNRGKEYQHAIILASLFDGVIYKDIASKTFDGDIEAIYINLTSSSLFEYDFSSSNKLRISHDLLRERLLSFASRDLIQHIKRTNLPYIIPIAWGSLYDSVSKKVLGIIESGNHFEETIYKQYHISLLCACSKWQEAGFESSELGKELLKRRDWGEAVHFYRLALQIYKMIDNSEDEYYIEKVDILCELLDAEYLRYRIGSDTNGTLLNYLSYLLEYNKNIDKLKLFQLKYFILHWRHFHVREEFKNAHDRISKGKKLVLKSLNEGIDEDILGKTLTSYGVSLKVLDDKQSSFDAFKEAKRLLPDSITVIAEDLSNIAAFALKVDPQQALDCYKELIKKAENTRYSFAEIIHANVDIAMANFLLKRYDDAKLSAENAINLSISNAIPAQEARGRNILGCYYYVKGNIEDADEQYELAILASERSISYRFLWKMRVNRMHTLLALENNELAYELAKITIKTIVEPREFSFDSYKNNEYLISKWYVALLCISQCLYILDKMDDLEELYRQLHKLPKFKKHSMDIIKGKFPKEVFENTTYLHNNLIILT